MKKNETLALMAMYCALFIVLDIISGTISLFKMPNGGKLNLGPIVLILCSYHLGVKQASFVCFVSVFIQLFIGSVMFYGLFSFVFDYVLSYCAYGISSLFPNKGKFYSGVLITSLLRLVFSTISGMVVWEMGLLPSLAYNATYLIPTLVACLIVVPIIHPYLKNM